MHLLSLTTGRPHPLARNPHLSRDVDVGPSSSHNFQIRIFGEYIGVMAETDEEKVELLVWDWKSAVIKKVSYFPKIHAPINRSTSSIYTEMT